MAYLSPVFLLTISYLTGILMQIFLGDNEDRPVKTCLIGTFFVLVIWEVIVLVCDYLGVSFIWTTKIFDIVMAIVFLCGLFLGRLRIKKQFYIKTGIDYQALIYIGLAFIIEILCFFILSPDTTNDYSVETVNTVITSNSIYGYDPLTGNPLEEVGFMDKIITLPRLYAFIAYATNTSARIVVYRCMPMWILSLSFMAYGLWGYVLFKGKNNQKNRGMILFLVGISVVNLCGTFSQNSIFYYQTLKCFSGENFCYSVIIPFILLECFEGIRNKKWQSVIYIVAAILCSLFVTEITVSLIPIAMLICLCLIVFGGYQIRRRLV